MENKNILTVGKLMEYLSNLDPDTKVKIIYEENGYIVSSFAENIETDIRENEKIVCIEG